jgi:prepilin signal peptidase PulO-like enzyme (type II secretory pathway)
MIIAILIVLGLCFGSFTNALVWRIHEQEEQGSKKKPNKAYLDKLSIRKGRSMCPHCKHELKAVDLLPVVSWMALRGKCRYCGKPISWQYPLVELSTAILYVASYIWWPIELQGMQVVLFVLWLVLLVGFMALIVYDLRWLLLPNRLVYPLAVVAGLFAIGTVIYAPDHLAALLNVVLAVAIGGGIFYVLFQVSDGKWIGGGDVKLGWLLGLVAATSAHSVLFIFLAAVLGSLVSLPLIATNRVKKNATIPFGPFLIIGLIITQLFGAAIIHWYRRTFLIA